MSNRDLFLTGAIFSIMGLLAISCSQRGPALLTERFVEAYNSHDINKIVALASDDVVLTAGDNVLRGKDKLAGIAQFDSTINAQFTLSNIKAEANSATFTITETNDWLKLAGIDSYMYAPCSITFKDTLATQITINSTPESKAKAQDLYGKIAEWSSKEHGQAIDPLAVYERNAQSAQVWMAMVKQWKAETAPK